MAVSSIYTVAYYHMNNRHSKQAKVRFYRGTPKRDTPKSYKEIGGCIRPHGTYESGCVTFYTAKDGTLRYSTYIDGCFYPLYGKCEVIQEQAEA